MPPPITEQTDNLELSNMNYKTDLPKRYTKNKQTNKKNPTDCFPEQLMKKQLILELFKILWSTKKSFQLFFTKVEKC